MEPEDLLLKAAEVCDGLELIYFVTGSTATITYGEPRFTNDIDIVLELSANQIDAFCDAFSPDEFYLNRITVAEAVKRGKQFNLIHPASGLKIDFIVLTETEFNRSRVDRRRELAILPDRTASFASP